MPAAASPFCCDVQALAEGMRFGAEGEDLEERVRGRLLGCVGRNFAAMIRKVIPNIRELRGREIDIGGLTRHVLKAVREKLNVAATAKAIWKLARSKGWRFAVFAVVWEFIEQVVFPAVTIWLGYPALAPVILAIHFEPFVYPIAMCLL